MSEIQYLTKMLAYCFNNNNPEVAKMIISELIKLKAKVKITSEAKYECSSHFYYFKKKLYTNVKSQIHNFHQCQHYVCLECIETYIKENYRKFQTSHNYICPGCLALGSSNPTHLDYREEYFSNIIPVDRYEFDKQLRYNQIHSKFTCGFSRFHFFGIHCRQEKEAYGISGCNHGLCYDCGNLYALYWGLLPEPELSCIECHNIIPHETIRGYLENIPGYEQNYHAALRKLRLHDNININCPGCNAFNSLTKDQGKSKCCVCEHILCCLCGNIYHNSISCFIIQQGIKEYREIECKGDDPNPELVEKFNHACRLFEWDLNKSGAEKLKSEYKMKLKVISVTYIYNPILLKKFENIKNISRKKGGLTDEICVFHSSDEDIYPEICKNGFKIGGIDTDIKIGKTKGYGIYTAADPVLSINYYKKKHKKVIMSTLTDRMLIFVSEF